MSFICLQVRIYVESLLQLESSIIDMEEHTAEASRARGEKLGRLVSAVEAFKNTTALAAGIARTQVRASFSFDGAGGGNDGNLKVQRSCREL